MAKFGSIWPKMYIFEFSLKNEIIIYSTPETMLWEKIRKIWFSKKNANTSISGHCGPKKPILDSFWQKLWKWSKKPSLHIKSPKNLMRNVTDVCTDIRMYRRDSYGLNNQQVKRPKSIIKAWKKYWLWRILPPKKHNIC